MIKTEFIEIKVTSINYQRLKDLGYEFEKLTDVIRIKSEHLSDGSQIKLDVICDNCGSEYNIIYAKYIINIKRNGFYNCKKCGLKNRSEEWSSSNPSTNEEYQKNKIKTFISNYGVDNPSKSELIKEKKRITTNKNYGVDNIFMRKDIMTPLILHKYGVEHPSYNKEILDKMKKGLIEKYGVDNVSKLPDIKKKKESKSIEKYGTKCVLQSEEIKSKIRETNLERYGIEYPMQSKEIFDKARLSAFKFKIFKNTDLYYQGSYELDFLERYYDRLIIENGHLIKYKIDGKNAVYHSDFYLPTYNLIIEIKSTYTFEKEFYKNLIKREFSIKDGYKFLFIMDKEYTDLELILNKNPLN
jgi:hypothetical protein